MSYYIPKVVQDPRFQAARALVKTGRAEEGAVEMFATLLEETISKHTDTSIDAAACFYEYGNAIFRSALKDMTPSSEEESDQAKPHSAKEAAAAAAESRLAASQQSQDRQDSTKAQPDQKPPPHNGEKIQTDQDNEAKQGAKTGEKSEPETGALGASKNGTTTKNSHVEDFQLALEMMENAYSIFEEKAAHYPSNDWIQHQMPRVLQGLGDVLRELDRLSDAADAYARALPYREEFVEAHDKDSLTLQHLKDRRLLVEANVLVAEALLGCEHGKHVVTTETKDMLVTADERVDYARGYYEKAREELQETVYLMGRIAATGIDLGNEKEDVCFAATLLMGVGETLVTFDETQLSQQSESDEVEQPAPKKLKSA